MSTREIHNMHRAEKRPFAVDVGENTAGQTTGKLPAGDTAASAVVTVVSKPNKDDGTPADSPTIGTVTINSTAETVNDRECSAGEAVKFAVTCATDQTYGDYQLQVKTTTTAGYILVDAVRFVVTPV